MYPNGRGASVPRPYLRYRFSRLACEASRCQLRFLIDRRRRFMIDPPACWSNSG